MKRFNILLHDDRVHVIHADVVRLGFATIGDSRQKVRAFLRQGRMHAVLPVNVIKRFKVTTPSNTYRPV